MSPATAPRNSARDGRLLTVDDRRGVIADAPITALAELLSAGDVVVVNDAATLPASLSGTTAQGWPVELRLAGTVEREGARYLGLRELGSSRSEPLRFRAVLFGEGDWRVRTEDRPPPPGVRPGERLLLGDGLTAVVEAVDLHAPRLLDVALYANGHVAGGAGRDPSAMRSEENTLTHGDVWRLIYRHGRPIQYAHLRAAIHLWDVQNIYATRPWCFEMPSAGRAIDGEQLLALRRRGVAVTAVTHGAGLSSTGDPALDRRLPLDEDFEVSLAAARTIAAAQRTGGKVIAVGTSVARALESAAAAKGRIAAMRGRAKLRLSGGYPRAVVDAVLSGVHEPGTSHFDLLCAFARPSLLMSAHAHAEGARYLGHEFGDFTLVMGAPPQRFARALSA